MVKMGEMELEELLNGILDKLKEHDKKISQLTRKSSKSKFDKSVMKVLGEQK